MAKYDVRHACSHTETHDIVGPEKDRAGKRAWFAGRVCSACYQAERRATAEAEIAKAQADVAGESLPALSGSDKQIAWANKIRARHAARMIAIRAFVASNDALAASKGGALVLDLIKTALRQPKAVWWIERANTPETVETVLIGIAGRRVEAGALDADLHDALRRSLAQLVAAAGPK